MTDIPNPEPETLSTSPLNPLALIPNPKTPMQTLGGALPQLLPDEDADIGRARRQV